MRFCLLFFVVLFSTAVHSASAFRLKCDITSPRSGTVYYKIYDLGDGTGRAHRFSDDIGDWQSIKYSTKVKITPGSIIEDYTRYVDPPFFRISRRTGVYKYRNSIMPEQERGKCVPIEYDPVPKKAMF